MVDKIHGALVIREEMLPTKWFFSLFSTTCPLWTQESNSVSHAAFNQCLIEHQYLNDGAFFGIYHEISQCLRDEYDIHCSVRDVKRFDEELKRNLRMTRGALLHKKKP